MSKVQTLHCRKCGDPFRPKGREVTCFACVKTKPKKLCSGPCGKEFRPKKKLERVCPTCQNFNQRTAGQFSRLENPDGMDIAWLRTKAWMQVAEGMMCRYCHVKLTVRNFSMDHRTPRDRGGDDSLHNLDFAVCQDCNIVKGPLTMEEFEAIWAALRKVDEGARGRFLAAVKTGAKLRFRAARGAK